MPMAASASAGRIKIVTELFVCRLSAVRYVIAG